MTMPAEFDRGFTELMQRVREGSEPAMWELVRTYRPYVLRAVRRVLHPRLRGKFDSDDFAQSVWADFYAARTRWVDLQRPQQLIGLLSRMARNKVVDEQRRRLATRKYGLHQEQPLPADSGQPQQALRSRDPSPSQWAMAHERWQRLLGDRTEQQRQIISLKLTGLTHRAVAQQLGVSEKTVQRVLQRIEQDAAE